ncbi:unnamed protein product [Soboliphyme baturini]|uniref:Testicular haploid expressed gene protein-like n=1 Tax=Soboliphyme baturini TaxID=241478 RepID=A0A183IYJ3_9BILA|nr:unnamed protein product [Soboliphyme baturini]
MPEAFRPRSSSGFKDSVILALSRKKRKYSKSEEWSFPLRSLKRRREAEQQWQPSFSLADRTPEPVDKWTFEICVSECSHLADNTDWSSSTSSIQRLPTITSPLPKTEERKAVFLDSKCPVTNPDKPLPAKRLKRNGALLRRLLTREPRSPPTDLTKIDWVRRDGLSFRMSMPIFQYHPKPAVPVIHYSEERAKRAQQYFQNRVEKLLFKPKMELPPTTTAEQSRQWELMTPSVAPAVVSLTPSSTISVVGSQSVIDTGESICYTARKYILGYCVFSIATKVKVEEQTTKV